MLKELQILTQVLLGINDPKIIPDKVAICQQTHNVKPVPIKW